MEHEHSLQRVSDLIFPVTLYNVLRELSTVLFQGRSLYQKCAQRRQPSSQNQVETRHVVHYAMRLSDKRQIWCHLQSGDRMTCYAT